MSQSPYIGRFAPSPTGPLHFGSLIAALGSYLDARRQGGQWLVRIEDLDPEREVAGASDEILRALDGFGLGWDGGVEYQSRRTAFYAEAIERLFADGLVYRCACSRKALREAAAAGGLTPAVYPGTCRSAHVNPHRQHSLRLRVEAGRLGFTDRIQGEFAQDLASEVGDFVVRRADGYHAYQLAVVLDDDAQGITDVVRGADLLDSTPRQLYLQQLLGLPTPRYAHLPVAVNAQGQKLSKQSFAAPLDIRRPGPALWRALRFLGQSPPAELAPETPEPILDWALRHWELAAVPRALQLPPSAATNPASD